MNATNDNPQTLLEAVRHFSDLDVCHEFMKQIKWPNGQITCPECSGDQIGEIATRRMFQCKAKGCRRQFSTKVGTIFEDSPLGMDKWLVIVWCIANAKNGISSCELARAIGITQKSAWHALHRVRLAMQTKTFRKIRGEIESDESFIGGKESNKHRSKKLNRGRGTVGKAIVHGLLERGGRVHTKVVENQKRATLHREIRSNVEAGSAVYTDALASYEGLDPEYVHGVIDHSIRYVEGRVHTNGMENFWSLLKRCLLGTYVAVSPDHLHRYLDEEVFRFNERTKTDAGRFHGVMASITGHRLTYAALTGANGVARL